MPQIYADRTLQSLIYDRMDEMERNLGTEVTQSEALLSLLAEDNLDEYERRVSHSTAIDEHLQARRKRAERCRQYWTYN